MKSVSSSSTASYSYRPQRSYRGGLLHHRPSHQNAYAPPLPAAQRSWRSSNVELRWQQPHCHKVILRSREEFWRTWIPEGGMATYSVRLSECQPSPRITSADPWWKEVSNLGVTHSRNPVQVLPCIGRVLLILGLGLGLSMPALAGTVMPAISTMSVKRSDDHEAAMKHDVVVDGLPNHELNESEFAGTTKSKNGDMSNDHLQLGEAFWDGIPTPEDSLLYSLKRQLNRYPGDATALEVLLRAVMEQRDFLRALTVLETLLEIQPNDLEWKFLKARTHEILGELLMAKKEYEEVLSVCPLSARFVQILSLINGTFTNEGLAMLLSKFNDQTGAFELIDHALNRAVKENKEVEARDLGLLLIQFHIQMGNFDNAIQQLAKMIEGDPHDFRPYLCQGLAYTLMDEMGKANQSFGKYMQLCPPDAFDQHYLDDLMLKAQTRRRNDALAEAASKGDSRNRKNSKPMRQPTLSSHVATKDDDFAD